MAVSVEVGWYRRFSCLSQKLNRPNTPLFLRNPMSIRFASSTTRTTWSWVVPRATDPKSGDQNSKSSYSSYQEDFAYVAKLAVGSFAGGGAIKCGSALFPEITTPNLVLALFIIFTPVLVAVFLLIKESRPKP